MIFLDTGYFVALLDPRDELHALALAWSVALNEPAILTEFILLETTNLFSHPAERPRVHALIDQLHTMAEYEIVPADSILFRAGLSLHRQRGDKWWSLTDCISFVVMQQRGIARALSYDKHFEQAGFQALLRSEPP